MEAPHCGPLHDAILKGQELEEEVKKKAVHRGTLEGLDKDERL